MGSYPIKGLYLTVKTETTMIRNMPFTALMRKKIDTPEGRLIYSQRMKIIEPAFANTTVQKGMNKFTLRGTAKVGIQNLLYYIVHNIGKIATAGAELYSHHIHVAANPADLLSAGCQV
jgi:hypothetical protein